MADVPTWVEKQFGVPGVDLLDTVVIGIVARQFRHRVVGLVPAPDRPLPSWLKQEQEVGLPDIVVTDWTKAAPDWRSGTVATWWVWRETASAGPHHEVTADLNRDGAWTRHPIEVEKAQLEEWLAPYAQAHRERAESPAAVSKADAKVQTNVVVRQSGWYIRQAIAWLQWRAAEGYRLEADPEWFRNIFLSRFNGLVLTWPPCLEHAETSVA